MDYNEQAQVFAQQAAHLRTVNNKTLFTALSAAGITRIIVTFDGVHKKAGAQAACC
jgi:hypothetical protein